MSNIYLIDFDKHLFEKGIKENFFYRRYCDDILVVCDSDKAKKIQEYIINIVANDYHLEIQNKKVELTEFRKNSAKKIRAFDKKKQLKNKVEETDINNEIKYYKSLQYLGFEYNGQKIYIRASSLSRYFRKMSGRIIKTIVMAYSNKSKDDKIKKKQILERYSHLGNRNFTTYAYNASKEFYTNKKGIKKEGMNSTAIKKQLANHFSILHDKLESKNNQRFRYKEYKGKATRKKKL